MTEQRTANSAEITRKLGMTPMQDVMEAQGITGTKLAQLLKEGMEARETKTIKVKGDIQEAPEGYKIIAKSVSKRMDREGVVHEFVGETVLQWDETLHDIRQRTRSDAHKLRNDYPPEHLKVDQETTIILKHNVPEPKPPPEGM